MIAENSINDSISKNELLTFQGEEKEEDAEDSPKLDKDIK